MRAPVRSALIAAVVVVGGSLVRRWAGHWGATAEEVTGELPGDDLVPEPHLTSTRAITIAAPVDQVFPWLAQLGQGRGGFYSYDRLESSIGLDIHSADRILPQFQEIAPGDRIAVAPEPPFYGFVVAEVTPPSRLVLQMRIHALTGLQIDALEASREPSVDSSWAFALEPIGATATRLVTRNRARVRVPWGLRMPYLLGLEVVEFVMERRMLLGIRDRAERNR